ncbi:MAG TPA: Phasin, partial [Rubellimicrobium sp.]|nr:Phasin [Rubellimicrobium sp.]
LSSFPVATAAQENLAKSQAALAEKLSYIAIDFAGRSTGLSTRWAQDFLSKLPDLARAQAGPADYAKAAGDFMSGSAETATEHLAAFAGIAKTVQVETLALLLTASKGNFTASFVLW